MKEHPWNARVVHANRCVVCKRRVAVTHDGTLCLWCLRAKIRDLNPENNEVSDQLGRPARAAQTLGGMPDMRTTEVINDGEEE